MKSHFDFSLKNNNTFGVDVKCKMYAEFDNVGELRELIDSLHPKLFPIIPIGEGSNMLFTKDIWGTIVKSNIKDIDTVKTDDNYVYVRVGSGMKWDDFVATAIGNGLHGAENLSYIPGTVGASAVQNIGAYGAEAKDIIYSVEVLEISSGRTFTFDNAMCDFDYRYSNFKDGWKDQFIVTHVVYRMSKTFQPRLDYGNIRTELAKRGIDSPTPSQLRNAIIDIRKQKLPDPSVEGNAGSFFKNPVVDKAKYTELIAQYPDMPHYDVDDRHVKIPTGWMIEQCGWKGKTIGNVGVHDKQALVLVNRGGATGEEILTLSKEIMKDVLDKFGIEINPEVYII